MKKKEDVHLQLSEELASIDIELDKAMEALSETNHRIDSFLNGDEEGDNVADKSDAGALLDEEYKVELDLAKQESGLDEMETQL